MRKRGCLKDGGVGTRVEGDGRDCGGGEGCGEESRRNGLHQVVLQGEFGCQRAGAPLLLVVRAVFGFGGFACHSVLVPPTGDMLLKLDF